jgi:hypothetical protein
MYHDPQKGGVKGESSEEDAKGVASVKTKNQRSLVKTKKMTKPKNKPTPKPRMVGAPKITTPAKSVDPKKREEV